MKLKRKTIIPIIVAILLVVGVAVAFHFWAFYFAGPFDSNPCITVVFDKQQMLSVDRIVFETHHTKKQFTITDPDMIHSVVKGTMVATCTDIQYPKDIVIQPHSGDELVRTMYCGDNYTKVHIYNEDELHWYLFKGTEPGEGCVLLSRELQDLLLSLEEQETPAE